MAYVFPYAKGAKGDKRRQKGLYMYITEYMWPIQY